MYQFLCISHLKVAEEYKLLGYEPHPLPAMDSYVLPGLPRPLLTGSGDYSATATRESNAKHATFEEERSLEITDIEDDNILEGFSLVAPSHIFKPTDCKPLDIYVCRIICVCHARTYSPVQGIVFLCVYSFHARTCVPAFLCKQ